MDNEQLMENTESMADYEEHFDDANPWNIVKDYLEKGTVLHVTIEGIVNGGAIAMVEGIRGFIPASRLSLSYIEDLESYLLKEVDVKVIEADQAQGRLILSAREILREQEKKAKEEQEKKTQEKKEEENNKKVEYNEGVDEKDDSESIINNLINKNTTYTKSGTEKQSEATAKTSTVEYKI